MNHIFRVIWNVSRAAFVVVSELVSSQGKATRGACAVSGQTVIGLFIPTAIAAALSLNTALAAEPSTQVASGNTVVYNAPNGVQVVDIATANAAGVSHNRYIKYNVDPTGQILNNNSALTKAGALQSQLAGQIVPNVNLTNEAKVILNEVVAANRSVLAGYTEVVGGKADVIVANPYGITCSGCGFINSDRATLTTGVPTLNADGSIAGFKVGQGDVLVNGAGLDARNQKVLDLVARSIKVDGQINGQDVGLVAGSNTFNYADRSTVAEAASGDTPLYAIDSTTLGGMYANRITLLATEHGLGVRMNGEAAASGDDFTLTADGKIEITNSLSAKRDLKVTYTGNNAADAGAITVSGSQARLTATQDLKLTAQNGAGITLSSGELNATRNLSIDANRLSDTSAGAKRFAGKDLSITTTGATTLDGSQWGAGNDLSAIVGSLNVGSSQTAAALLYSGSGSTGTTKALTVRASNGNIELAKVQVQSAGTLELTAQTGNIVDTAATSLKATGDITLAAAGSLDHAGSLQGGANTTLKASDASASFTNRASGTLSTTGNLILGENGHVLDVTNLGSINAGGNLSAQVLSFTNGSASNATAKLLAATLDGIYATINASLGLVNYGTLLSNQSLSINAYGIDNRATGGLAALNHLELLANGDTRLDNRGAIYGGSTVSLNAGGASNGVVRNWGTGTIDSNGSVTSTSTDFINNGAVVSLGAMTFNVSRSFVNQTLYNDYAITKGFDAIRNTSMLSDDKIANEGGGNDGMDAWMYDQEFWRAEHFEGRDANGNVVTLSTAQVAALQKAQLLATGSGATLSVNYGSGTALNSGGVLSANNIVITGTGAFTNQDLVLYDYNQVRRWIIIDDGDGHIGWARIDPDTYCYRGAPADCRGRDDDISGSPDDDDYNWDTWNPGAGWVQTTQGNAASTAIQGAVLKGANVIGQTGAGIYATNLTMNVGELNNEGSPWPTDTSKVKQGTAVAGSVTAQTGAAGASTPGISLPTNPNGYFVTNKDPKAKYLVETNPNFAVGSNFVGSDYLATRYGFNPDDVQKRLGDANYEGYLVRQQLIQLTGNNVLNGYADEGEQMQKLMDQAYNQGQNLGLEFGKALTPEQAAKLTQDIIWMEPTVVNGETVLVPKVYLAAATVASIDKGAVIGAENLAVNADSLNNTGGTIAGSKTLEVKTTGDITNTSGTIKGGDVSVTSTEGSIRNETVAKGAGDGTTYVTAIGKTASIESTNNLKLDAGKDITVLGADVKAGGDASLAAKGDVTFDTIVDKNTTTHYTESSGFMSSSSTRTSVSTEKNIGSNLSTGGNLSIKSGGDTTLAGSKADVGGNLDAQTGGSFNVVARQDKEEVDVQKTKSGMGVGGGVYGSQKTTQNDFTGTNVGSTLNVGGNANIDAAKQVVVQGSDVDVKGNADIKGTEGIQVLDGLDEKRSYTKVETTTFLKMDNSGGAEAKALAGTEGLSAGASANAKAGGSSNLKLAETSTTVTNTGSNTSVASNLKVGGNLNMKSDGDVTVQGSNVEAGGDLGVDAKSVNVLTGRNEEWSNSETKTTSIGIYNDAEASAGASASAGVDNYGGASADVNAKAEAGSTTTLGVRTEHSTENSYSLTNSSSTLKSGGNMNINAKDTATFQGANVESGGDMTIQAKDIKNVAAQDISTSSSSASTLTAGVYLGTSASAQAGANASSNGKSEAGASAEAEASAGLRVASESENNSEKSVTQVTNSFKSGGNFTRTATNTIVDQGTQVEAGGNITQSAREIRDEAISDSSTSSSDAQSHDARIGVYAGAEAKADAAEGGSAEAGVGLKASYQGSISNEKSAESTAVTSKFKAGGNISSTSTEKTTLVGTQFESGGDTTIEAGSLDFQAAKDTASSSSNSHDISVEAKVSETSASLEAGYDMSTAKEQSSTAKAGSITAGGNLTIKTKNDATFEGTNLAAGKDATVAAGGNVTFNEARDTASSSSTDLSVNVGVSSSKSDGGGSEKEGEAGLGVGYQQAKSSTAQVGSISAGGDVKVSSGKNVTLVGTQVESGGSTELSGKKVNLESAESSSSSFGVQVGVSVSGSSGGDDKGGSTADKKTDTSAPAKKADDKEEDDSGPVDSASFGINASNSSSSTNASIKAGNGVTIKQNP